MHKMKSNLKTQQSGMVSIVVTVIVMLLISLVVISFARNSRREQRQALDRQLSTQAFYAAETGVNDAIKALTTNPNLSRTDCNTVDTVNFPNEKKNLSAADGVGYTCVLIDPNPDNAQYDNIGTDGSKVIPVQSTTPSTNITSIRLSWQARDGTNDSDNTSTGCANDMLTTPLTPSTSWPTGCPGAMRVDVVPFPVGASLDRTTLTGSTMTTFLLPKRSAGVVVPCSPVPNPNFAAEQAAYNDWNTRNGVWTYYNSLPNWAKPGYAFFLGYTPTNPGAAPPTPQATITPPGPCYGGGGPQPTLAYGNTGFPNQGQIVVTGCHSTAATPAKPYQCNMEITFPSPTTQYVLRLRSIYRASIVNISALNGATPQKLKSAQAIVDVTGKANDVLRRINVRVPTSTLGSGIFPDYAVLSADSLCKRFSVAPGLPPQYDTTADITNNPGCVVAEPFAP